MLFKSQNTEAWEMEIHHLAVQVHYPVTEQKMCDGPQNLTFWLRDTKDTLKSNLTDRRLYSRLYKLYSERHPLSLEPRFSSSEEKLVMLRKIKNF